MSHKLSSNAIIYAILSIDSEIKLQQEYLQSTEIPEQDIENEQEMLSELEQALAEFISVYKNYRAQEKKLPPIDELLNNPL